MAALVVGQFGAIGLLVGTGFALPFPWRTSGRAGPLLLGQAGVLLLAGCAGMAVARTSLPGPEPVLLPGMIVVAGLGAALVLAALLARHRSVSRAATRADVLGTRQQTTGLVTEATQTGTVNQVPRWRVVVRFTDASGATRWVTKHTST
jgi:hypothetical protein